MPVTYLGPICKFLDISADYLLDLINEPISLKEQKGIQ